MLSELLFVPAAGECGELLRTAMTGVDLAESPACKIDKFTSPNVCRSSTGLLLDSWGNCGVFPSPTDAQTCDPDDFAGAFGDDCGDACGSGFVWTTSWVGCSSWTFLLFLSLSYLTLLRWTHIWQENTCRSRSSSLFFSNSAVFCL